MEGPLSIRVVSIYYTHKPGGFCRRLYRGMDACAKAGAQIIYLSLDPVPSGDHSFTTELIPFPMKRRSGLMFWALFTAWVPLWLCFKLSSLKPHRIMVFGAYYSFLTSLYALIHGVPIILFVRGISQKVTTRERGLGSFLLHRLEGAGLRAATRIVAVHEEMAKQLRQLFELEGRAIEVLPNDIRITRGFGSSNAPYRILAAGTLTPSKNFGLLIEAIALLPIDLREKMQLSIAGEGREEGSLRLLMKERGIKEVTLEGWVPSLLPLLERCDLFIHPSLSEGMPNVVLEALGHGVPVIASDIPELRHILKCPELLFIPTPQALAARLTVLVTSPSAWEAVGELSGTLALTLTHDWDASFATLVLTDLKKKDNSPT